MGAGAVPIQFQWVHNINQHHMLGLQRLHRTVSAGAFDLTTRQQLAVACNALHARRLEPGNHTFRQLGAFPDASAAKAVLDISGIPHVIKVLDGLPC